MAKRGAIMNQQAEREHLEDVLHAYLAAASDPNYATLNEWVRRYPYYEQELTEFTVARNLLHTLPEPVVTEQAEAELMNFGKGMIQSLVSTARGTRKQVNSPLTSLLAAGSAIGLKLPDIAKRTRLSAALVRKLDRRLFRFTTLPREIIEELGRVLKQETNTIARYLQLPPTLAAGASYRAEQAPKLAEAEDFAAALKNDLSISPEDRDYWLQKALGS